jgi:hypothetical protein
MQSVWSSDEQIMTAFEAKVIASTTAMVATVELPRGIYEVFTL